MFHDLTRDAMPVLRYRTRDIASLDPSPCLCGRRSSGCPSHWPEGRHARRPGVNVYPSECRRCSSPSGASGRSISWWSIAPRACRGCGACELAAGWSICSETEEAERNRVADEVEAAMGQRLGLATEVKVLPVGTIPRIEMGKAQRVVERTADNNPLPGWL